MAGSSAGKRAGARRGPRPKRAFRPRLLVLALGITLLVVAWGYLVYAAIDFGTQARAGESAAWAFLGLASLGAVACLFAGLMLVVRVLRELGITQPPSPGDTSGPPADPANPSRPRGGRRAR